MGGSDVMHMHNNRNKARLQQIINFLLDGPLRRWWRRLRYRQIRNAIDNFNWGIDQFGDLFDYDQM